MDVSLDARSEFIVICVLTSVIGALVLCAALGWLRHKTRASPPDSKLRYRLTLAGWLFTAIMISPMVVAIVQGPDTGLGRLLLTPYGTLGLPWGGFVLTGVLAVVGGVIERVAPKFGVPLVVRGAGTPSTAANRASH